MDIYEKFRNEIETPLDFNWRAEWDALKGVEEFINYSDELVGVSSLKKFDSKNHLRENFTGFVDSENNFFKINDEDLVFDSIFIEKGKIKYGTSFEKWGRSLHNLNRFFQDNFSLTKIYDFKRENKLSQVYFHSSFEVENYKINFSRFEKEEAYLYLSKNTDDWFDFELNEEKINLLESKVFDNVESMKDFFRGVRGNFVQNFNVLEEKYSFEEALKFIR